MLARFASVALVTMAGAVLACSPSSSSKGMVSEEALAIAVQKSGELEEQFALERKQFESTIADLRAENNELRSRLGLAENVAKDAAARATVSEDTATRYQEGLNRAVSELNRVGQQRADDQRQAASALAAAAAAPATHSGAGSKIFFASPSLSIVDRSLVASGSAHNSSDVDAVGTLVLTLARDGNELQTVTQPIRVSAGTWTDWSQQFGIPGPEGQYSVRARFER